MLSRIIAVLRQIHGFIPSVRDIEEIYLNGAESPAERESRRREIRAGRFRNAFAVN